MRLSAAEENELLDLENSLLDPATRASPERLEGILSEGYVEYGASGRVYDRSQTIAAVTGSRLDPCTVSDFSARWLDPGIALAEYRLIRQASGGQAIHSLRHSIWRKAGGKWKILFHQGIRLAPGV
jgi:hypothetical protein